MCVLHTRRKRDWCCSVHLPWAAAKVQASGKTATGRCQAPCLPTAHLHARPLDLAADAAQLHAHKGQAHHARPNDRDPGRHHAVPLLPGAGSGEQVFLGGDRLVRLQQCGLQPLCPPPSPCQTAAGWCWLHAPSGRLTVKGQLYAVVGDLPLHALGRKDRERHGAVAAKARAVVLCQVTPRGAHLR